MIGDERIYWISSFGVSAKERSNHYVSFVPVPLDYPMHK